MTPQIQTWPGLGQFESLNKPVLSLCCRFDLLVGVVGVGLGVCLNGVGNAKMRCSSSGASCLTYLRQLLNVVTYVATRHGVWIDNCIYWALKLYLQRIIMLSLFHPLYKSLSSSSLVVAW
jgi:hypothetical protein